MRAPESVIPERFYRESVILGSPIKAHAEQCCFAAFGDIRHKSLADPTALFPRKNEGRPCISRVAENSRIQLTFSASGGQA
ncbi:MAG: hypothetical protein A3B72_02195 [Omnitrophica bacterium RIFCSPHIGHO2_02_FULL_45_28]|nr:MAG: hypothetical protein A3B72_02195 [Omnitrophica bacterium RIFCSPHIGHO2_02_FULL_45_28]